MPTPHDWCPTLNRNRPILLFSHAATPTILLGWSARAGSRPISSTRTVPLVVGKRLTRAMQKEPCWTRPANGKDIKTNMDVESCLKSCLIKIDVLDEHLVYNNIPLYSVLLYLQTSLKLRNQSCLRTCFRVTPLLHQICLALQDAGCSHVVITHIYKVFHGNGRVPSQITLPLPRKLRPCSTLPPNHCLLGRRNPSA